MRTELHNLAYTLYALFLAMRKKQINLKHSLKEWEDIHAIAEQKKMPLGQHIREKLMKEFAGVPACEPCNEGIVVKKRRRVDVAMPEDLIRRIQCKASTFGISFELLVKLIVSDEIKITKNT